MLPVKRIAMVSGMILTMLTMVVGCGQPSANPDTQSQTTPSGKNFTSVEIIRPKHGNLKALDVTITNPKTVQTLYSDLISSPKFPSGTMNCPADFGINYTLKFMSGNKVALTATADPNGCQNVNLSTGKDLRGDKSFFTALAQSLGYSNQSELSAVALA